MRIGTTRNIPMMMSAGLTKIQPYFPSPERMFLLMLPPFRLGQAAGVLNTRRCSPRRDYLLFASSSAACRLVCSAARMSFALPPISPSSFELKSLTTEADPAKFTGLTA